MSLKTLLRSLKSQPTLIETLQKPTEATADAGHIAMSTSGCADLRDNNRSSSSAICMIGCVMTGYVMIGYKMIGYVMIGYEMIGYVMIGYVLIDD